MPVPALPDSERRTTYTVALTMGPLDVSFDLYGDGSDYGNWVEVWLDGVELTPTTDWVLTSPSGSLNAIARPIVDAEITFPVPLAGDVTILGARRPRRTTQFTEGAAVPAATLNRTVTDLVATQRETWDFLSRTIRAQSGETFRALRPKAEIANAILGFDADGEPFATVIAEGSVLVSPFSATLLDDTTAAAFMTTLGVSAFVQTIFNDADAGTVRGTLGLGTMATQAASAVAITGGSIAGITDLAIADGGTGASSAAAAFTALKQAASDTATGVVELLTDAETVTGTDTTRAATAANLVAKMSAPGAIGNTTPSTGAFSTISASGLISANGGQIAFPASQNASANANTLDDYEEGTWTPVFTFATPGDLSVAYSVQSGDYLKIGNGVRVTGQITLSTFTHTTASGAARITGLPFTAAATGHSTVGSAAWTGITKAGYTQIGAFITTGVSLITWFAFASASAISLVVAADMPTGGAPNLATTCNYHV